MIRKLARSTAPAVLALALAGCTGIGDRDPHAPLPPGPGAGASLEPAGAGAIAQQTFVTGETTPRAWWEQFSCDQLNVLVQQALSANNDLAAADAALRAAQAQAKAAGGALGPTVDAGYSAQRARTPATLAPPVTDPNQLLYTLHTAQVTVSYPVDLFGELHARHRSAMAAAGAAKARLLAARQSVAANVVTAAISRAALEEQIAATKAMIAATADSLEMMRRRLRLGAVGDADVAAQEAALATLEGSLPALERGEAHQRTVLAVLLGRAPGDALPSLPQIRCIALPKQLPVALPADVVRYRPDMMAAAAAVQGAAADAHAAVAARFPALTLSADGGGTAQNFGEMFKSANLFWSILGGLTAPIFHAGALRHQQEAAVATFEQSKAQYRTAVLQAFADVSDALHGLHDDATALEAAERGVAAAERSYAYVRRQQELGDVGTLSVLNAQTTFQQARLQAISARSARLVDTVALYQANGAAPE